MVQKVRNLVNDQPFVDKNTSDPGGAGTTFDVADGSNYERGNILEFQDNGEQVLVRSVATNTLTVYRAQNGTTAQAHGVGSTFVVNPVVSYTQITGSVDDTTKTLWPYVYYVQEYDVTVASGTQWYNLGATALELIQVLQLQPGTPTRPFFYGARGNAYPVAIRRNLPAALVASGVGLYLPYLRDTTNHVFVQVAEEITAVQSGGNYTRIEDGLMQDMIVYGATARVVAALDVPRVTEDDVTMSDQTVNPGSRIRVSSYFDSKYIELRNQLRLRQQSTHPLMLRKAGVNPEWI